MFNDERLLVLVFIPLSSSAFHFAQNSFDFCDELNLDMWVTYWMGQRQMKWEGAVRFAQNPGVVSESVIRG